MEPTAMLLGAQRVNNGVGETSQCMIHNWKKGRGRRCLNRTWLQMSRKTLNLLHLLLTYITTDCITLPIVLMHWRTLKQGVLVVMWSGNTRPSLFRQSLRLLCFCVGKFFAYITSILDIGS